MIQTSVSSFTLMNSGVHVNLPPFCIQVTEMTPNHKRSDAAEDRITFTRSLTLVSSQFIKENPTKKSYL